MDAVSCKNTKDKDKEKEKEKDKCTSLNDKNVSGNDNQKEKDGDNDRKGDDWGNKHDNKNDNNNNESKTKENNSNSSINSHYTYDELSACETIMNESLAFSCDMSFLVVPFIWPCEGALLDYDVNKIQETKCCQLFLAFVKRLHTLFGIIDFVGHGKGCTILLRTLEQIQRDRVEIIKNKSHVVCIAPDIVEKEFCKHVKSIQNNVKRVTLYVNTWDWRLFASKWWNWTDNRAGASIIVDNLELTKLDTIDTTKLLAGWFTGNHWYFTNQYFKNHIKQALSIIGGFARFDTETGGNNTMGNINNNDSAREYNPSSNSVNNNNNNTNNEHSNKVKHGGDGNGTGNGNGNNNFLGIEIGDVENRSTNDIIPMTPQQKVQFMRDQHNLSHFNTVNALNANEINANGHIRDASMSTHHNSSEIRENLADDDSGDNNNRKFKKSSKIRIDGNEVSDLSLTALDQQNDDGTPIENELGNLDISRSNDTVTPIAEMSFRSPNKNTNNSVSPNNTI